MLQSDLRFSRGWGDWKSSMGTYEYNQWTNNFSPNLHYFFSQKNTLVFGIFLGLWNRTCPEWSEPVWNKKGFSTFFISFIFRTFVTSTIRLGFSIMDDWRWINLKIHCPQWEIDIEIIYVWWYIEGAEPQCQNSHMWLKDVLLPFRSYKRLFYLTNFCDNCDPIKVLHNGSLGRNKYKNTLSARVRFEIEIIDVRWYIECGATPMIKTFYQTFPMWLKDVLLPFRSYKDIG